MKSVMTIKGNKCLAPKGHVNEVEVSCFVSRASHMGFFTFSKSKFPRYVLYNEIEISTSRNSRFLVAISLTINYVPT